jgi:hypothetical protein
VIRLAFPEPARITVPSVRAFLLPLAFAAGLALLVLLPPAAQSRALTQSLLAAAGALGAWTALLVARAQSLGGRTLSIDLVPKKQHYVQALAQASIFLYWGWYWRDVYRFVPLLVAELLFAYAFDALLAWSRRDVYALGFGPFPVIFSINLFLWFKPEWFYLQFGMVALGFTAKEFIRWDKDGKRAHVFNPSSFPLALASVGLLVTGATKMTRGPEIATTLGHAPGIYAFIFAAGLVGQYLFGVTTMTLSAVLTLYGLGRVYLAATGTYFFRDEYIPIAVFLGMQLLFTDPSTAPRTELGRLVFGALYAIGIMVTARILDACEVPGFYDKLLPVPLLNLAIRAIDRVAQSGALARVDPGRLGRTLAPQRRNLVYVGVWTVVFATLTLAHAWRNDRYFGVAFMMAPGVPELAQ